MIELSNEQKELLERVGKILREYSPDSIAADLCKVQPMPSTCIKDLYKDGKDTAWLLKNNYSPVNTTTKLMWVKSSKDDG